MVTSLCFGILSCYSIRSWIFRIKSQSALKSEIQNIRLESLHQLMYETNSNDIICMDMKRIYFDVSYMYHSMDALLLLFIVETMELYIYYLSVVQINPTLGLINYERISIRFIIYKWIGVLRNQ